MPTYDYACTDCDHQWEAFQSMKDDPLDTCPDCGKRSAKRLIGGGAGLIFKGSGFYITDYKNKPSGGDKAKSDSAKPAAKEKSSSSSSSSDKS